MQAIGTQQVCAVALGAMGAGTAVNYAADGHVVSALVRSGKSAARGLFDVWQDLRNRVAAGDLTETQAQSALENLYVFAGGDSAEASQNDLHSGLKAYVDAGQLTAEDADKLAKRTVVLTRDMDHATLMDRAVDMVQARGQGRRISFDRQVEAIERAENAILAGIDPAMAVAACVATFVTESATEKAEEKQEIFAKLALACLPGTKFTSNSSAYPADVWAAKMPLELRIDCANVHGFNPPESMRWCEVAGDEYTSPETIEFIMALQRQIGQRPVLLDKATPGFVANVLQWTVFAATAHVIESGHYGTREDIEAAFKETVAVEWGWRGPFACLVEDGIDETAAMLERVADKLPDVTQPPQALADALAQGHLGMKSGHGVTGSWPPERTKAVVAARRAGLRQHKERDRLADAGTPVPVPAFPAGKPLSALSPNMREAMEIIVACGLRQMMAMVEAGVVTPAVIDAVMLGTVYKRYEVTPPPTSADLTGLEVLSNIGDTVRPLLDTNTTGLGARWQALHSNGQLPEPVANATLTAGLARVAGTPSAADDKLKAG